MFYGRKENEEKEGIKKNNITNCTLIFLICILDVLGGSF
jgi:hypothetical protein